MNSYYQAVFLGCLKTLCPRIAVSFCSVAARQELLLEEWRNSDPCETCRAVGWVQEAVAVLPLLGAAGQSILGPTSGLS